MAREEAEGSSAANKPVSTAVVEMEEDDIISELSDAPPEAELEPEEVEDVKGVEEERERDMFDLPPMKKRKVDMSVEEFEQMLDEEGDGGFLEGGDIAPT